MLQKKDGAKFKYASLKCININLLKLNFCNIK